MSTYHRHENGTIHVGGPGPCTTPGEHEMVHVFTEAELDQLFAEKDSEIDDKSDIGHAVADAWMRHAQELKGQLDATWAAYRDDFAAQDEKIGELLDQIKDLTADRNSWMDQAEDRANQWAKAIERIKELEDQLQIRTQQWAKAVHEISEDE